jgi:mono/diheme cytochrome c family protein
MKSQVLRAVFLVCVTISCNGNEKSLVVRIGSEQKKIPLSALKNAYGNGDITVDDHYLKRRVTYRVLSLPRMLKAFVADFPEYDEFVFRCADGYLAHVSRADFEAGKLENFSLAYGEDADAFRSKLPQGKAEISPEPFYAVTTDEAGFQTLSWPYEIVAIELINFKQMFPALFFAGMEKNANVSKGFAIFRKECLKCHSLNIQGGDVGPELNVPQNITEYRDTETLKKFIRNASAFRAKSKMPPYTHLSDAQIGDIIAYLREMRFHKTGRP